MRALAFIVAVIASLGLANQAASANTLTGPGDAASQGSYDASTNFQVNG